MAEPLTATELLFDEHQLARRARTTLAGAERGALVIADGSASRFREYVVSVADDEGEAMLSAAARGAVAEAAQRRAHAALMLEPNEQFGVGLTLIGRLGLRSGGSERDFLDFAGRLSVERVLVSCPRAGLDVSRPRREIPLVGYAAAEPDRIAAQGARIARHLTDAHQAELRVLVARRGGMPANRLAGIQVSRVAADGLQLWWIDVGGAHRLDLAFEPPARDLTDLGQWLHTMMGPRSDG